MELLFFLCLEMIAIKFILGSTTAMCKHTEDDNYINRGPSLWLYNYPQRILALVPLMGGGRSEVIWPRISGA